MIKDRQVRQLRKLLAAGMTLERAAWKTDCFVSRAAIPANNWS